MTIYIKPLNPKTFYGAQPRSGGGRDCPRVRAGARLQGKRETQAVRDANTVHMAQMGQALDTMSRLARMLEQKS